jgi:hypothetical protein
MSERCHVTVAGNITVTIHHVNNPGLVTVAAIAKRRSVLAASLSALPAMVEDADIA